MHLYIVVATRLCYFGRGNDRQIPLLVNSKIRCIEKYGKRRVHELRERTFQKHNRIAMSSICHAYHTTEELPYEELLYI